MAPWWFLLGGCSTDGVLIFHLVLASHVALNAVSSARVNRPAMAWEVGEEVLLLTRPGH